MDKKLKEYKLNNGSVTPKDIAIKLAEMNSRLDSSIAKIKADLIKAKNNRANK